MGCRSKGRYSENVKKAVVFLADRLPLQSSFSPDGFYICPDNEEKVIKLLKSIEEHEGPLGSGFFSKENLDVLSQTGKSKGEITNRSKPALNKQKSNALKQKDNNKQGDQKDA